tara:strand:- start:513 stop:1073 length:561 start_codon:yes stop_codon:yes gene_type:complete
MHFKIIVAVCRNNGIGLNQKLPWTIKEDLQHFSKTTKGKGNNAIVMGKNTWLSFGGKPLPKRDHLILSSSLHEQGKTTNAVNEIEQHGRCKVFPSIDGMKKWCAERNYDEIWIIGGESIYKQFINDPLTTEICVTNIDKEFDCDTFFPLDDITQNWQKQKTYPLLTTQDFMVTISIFLPMSPHPQL